MSCLFLYASHLRDSVWLGLHVPLSQVTVDIYQIGIGVVLIKYYMPPMWPAFLGGRPSLFWMLECVTPEEPLLQRCVHTAPSCVWVYLKLLPQSCAHRLG